MKKRVRRGQKAPQDPSAGQAMEAAAPEKGLAHGGLVRADRQNISLHDYTEELQGWLPGRVVTIIALLWILFILIVAWLISRGYGAAG